jgi:hypothetical protein
MNLKKLKAVTAEKLCSGELNSTWIGFSHNRPSSMEKSEDSVAKSKP